MNSSPASGATQTKDKYSRLEILIYAICWMVIFLLPLCLELYDKLSGEITAIHWDRVANSELMLLSVFLLFLLNNFVLLPQLFFKKRKIWYFSALIVCFVALWCMQEPPVPRYAPPQGAPPAPRFDMYHITNLIIELCVLFANFAIKVYVHSLRRDMLMLNISNEKMQTELQSLRYQIGPHFLMNTLNNIQSLIDTDPERASRTIQNLSRLLRYMLYENDAHTVSLQKEVDFMTSLIDLMKIRYPDTVRVSAAFPDAADTVKVPPLLFISFLENAFKHGVSYTDESFISVNLNIENGHLLFKCANSKNQRKPDTTHRKGIGIENVRRRLDLIYGSDYELKITDSEKLYVVEIDLPIQKERRMHNE